MSLRSKTQPTNQQVTDVDNWEDRDALRDSEYLVCLHEFRAISQIKSPSN